MNVLTHEVAKALRDRVNANDPLELIRATEQAVLSKLAAGVSVEPTCYASINKQGDVCSTLKQADGWRKTPLYTPTKELKP